MQLSTIVNSGKETTNIPRGHRVKQPFIVRFFCNSFFFEKCRCLCLCFCRLEQSKSLNKKAQKWAKHLLAIRRLEHSDDRDFGENVAYKFASDTRICSGRCNDYFEFRWRPTPNLPSQSISKLWCCLNTFVSDTDQLTSFTQTHYYPLVVWLDLQFIYARKVTKSIADHLRFTDSLHGQEPFPPSFIDKNRICSSLQCDYKFW